MKDHACNSHSMLNIDCAFNDPSHIDPELPPSFTQFSLKSGEANIAVKMWLAGGSGTKGTVIISPPMGGSNMMNSIVIPLMYAGIHVISYQPRGVRDPKVTYSMPKSVDDVHAVINWIVENSGTDKTAMFGPRLRLDPSRIATFGLSGGGGNVSCAACAESKHVQYVIAAAPANVDVQLAVEAMEANQPMFKMLKEATGGQVDYETWLTSMTAEEKKRLSIIQNAPKLASKHLLMLGASHDEVSPIDLCHKPNVKALREAGAKDLTDLIIETDHGFLTKRYTLARVIIEWLRSQGF